MANEWTKADVLRVIREVTVKDDYIVMSKVRKQFNLKTAASKKQFAACITELCADRVIDNVSIHYFLNK